MESESIYSERNAEISFENENENMQGEDETTYYAGDGDESNGNEDSDADSEEDSGSSNDGDAASYNVEDQFAIDGLQDFANVNWEAITIDDFMKFHFGDREVAFKFYNWYARVRGFSARKNKTGKVKSGEVVRQSFVCCRHGTHVPTTRPRKRAARRILRCGCKAQCKVHFCDQTNRWHVTGLMDDHNHKMLDERFQGMLPSHRKMDNDEIKEMKQMRDVGISTPSIYQSFASKSGGFENVGFHTCDMYNEIVKQKRMLKNDAIEALEYLDELARGDTAMFFRHKVDDEGRLEHLFWCDGLSQVDYKFFGDVLAFDATYGKKKYYWPLVVFSGVNHHTQTTVFAFVVISNETEDTYVWVLEQFLAAMKGKSPNSVITDGDRAMRNAIVKVFPNATHRLCAWHLMRNATSNMGKEGFTTKFSRCMLGDFDIGDFKLKWDNMITEYGVEDNRWVLEMYEKRSMWATAYIRGKFFAGLRTTSRCEGLHSQLKKFVNYRNNLTDFLRRLNRCVSYIRQKEMEADFSCAHGEQALETSYRELEHCASEVYTYSVFVLFRRILSMAQKYKVVGLKKSLLSTVYFVRKHVDDDKDWFVSFCTSNHEMKCSCKRFESFGIPCYHIIVVMIHLDINELPRSLVLDRWTKKAKVAFWRSNHLSPKYLDSLVRARKLALEKRCQEMVEAASLSRFGFYDTMDKVERQTEFLNRRNNSEAYACLNDDGANNCILRDPIRVGTKGCSGALPTSGGQSKRKPGCSTCKREGHNRTTCPLKRRMDSMASSSQMAEDVAMGEDDGQAYDDDY